MLSTKHIKTHFWGVSTWTSSIDYVVRLRKSSEGKGKVIRCRNKKKEGLAVDGQKEKGHKREKHKGTVRVQLSTSALSRPELDIIHMVL